MRADSAEREVVLTVLRVAGGCSWRCRGLSEICQDICYVGSDFLTSVLINMSYNSVREFRSSANNSHYFICCDAVVSLNGLNYLL